MVRTTAAGLAATMTLVAGIVVAAEMPHGPSTGVVVATASEHASTRPIGDADAMAGDAARATSMVVDAKPEAASPPTSRRFVLLGLGVVLVGVIARQRRRFRRSGTILYR